MSKARNARIGVAAFFLLLTVIGMFTLRDYTGSYDQSVQRYILKVNLHEYATLLGMDGQNPLWEGLPAIRDFVERDHGISPMYVCAPFLSMMESSSYTGSLIWCGIVWLWFMAGVLALYMLARRLGSGRLLSCGAALLLYLSPQFFAHAHFNDKDIVLLSLTLLCLWQGSRFLEKMTWKRAIPFAFFGAMAANMRLVGAMAFFAVGLCCVLWVTLRREWSPRRLGLAAVTVVIFLGFYALLTPDFLRDPVGSIAYRVGNTQVFSRWEGTIWFRNASFKIPEQPLPRYYLLYMILVTVPLLVPVLMLIGCGFALKSCIQTHLTVLRDPAFMTLCAGFLCFLVPVAAFTVLQPMIYSGWRHFYFAYSGMLIPAAYGMGQIRQSLATTPARKGLLGGLLAINLAACALGIAMNHPNEACYYNALAGQDIMETDYWNNSGTGALRRLLQDENRDTNLPLEVGCWFLDIQNSRFLMTEEERAAIQTTTAGDAPYLYYIEHYVQVYTIEKPVGYHELFTVESYGRKVATMYERDAE